MNTLNQVELSGISGGYTGDDLETLKVDYSSLWQQILNVYNQQVERAETAFLRLFTGSSEN